MKEEIVCKCEIKTKCDVKNCKNDAELYFPSKDRRGKFFVCAECMSRIAAASVKMRTPKSPENTIKRIIERKEKMQNGQTV